ncbi:MAG: DUF475 domain-containing protein [Candidatus Moranbacteria bacterium]|nr:DUF475 domain-containing protein [Candidatus Moranbacteria bacterium]
MDIFSIILIVGGLFLFEVMSSIDNAIINAEVLSTMGEKAKKWFLTWGIFFAVFVVRGLLPWLIVWLAVPGLGFFDAFTAAFSSDPRVKESVDTAAPILLIGGGIFLIFLFFHWLFVEPKNYGLRGERFFHRQSAWFYAVVSLILMTVVWMALKQSPMLAFGAVVGSTVFFITHGFKQQAEESEKRLMKGGSSSLSDLSKLFYLEAIDMTFSLDGVLGAFAFTLSVPLILIGNSLGALVVRQLTLGNIERIQKYRYLKNGAMYSIVFLGAVMLADAFGVHVPAWVSPAVTFSAVGYFLWKSYREL